MSRTDISDNLFTKESENGYVSAFANLLNILGYEKLKGGTGFVRTGQNCISFTEAPLDAISQD